MPPTDPTQITHGTSSATRVALLDAAEVLFAEHGIRGASLRAITRAADANLAAVSYHFGSKEGLVRAVFERRIGPIQEQRMAGLAACLKASDPPDLNCLLRAFLEPVVCFLDGASSGGSRPQEFARLLGRSLHDPAGDTRHVIKQLFRPAVEGYTAALARALPDLSPAEVFWRFHFTVGAMAHSVSLADVARQFSGGVCDPSDADSLLRYMVTFLEAAWRAPAAPSAGSSPAASPDTSPDISADTSPHTSDKADAR